MTKDTNITVGLHVYISELMASRVSENNECT